MTRVFRLLLPLALCALPCIPSAAADGHPLASLNLPAGWAWPPSAPMRAREAECLRELDGAGLRYVRVDGLRAGQVLNPIWVESGSFGPLQVRSVRTDRSPVMDCELAMALLREAPGLSALGVRTLLVGRVIHDRQAVLRGRSVNLRSRHSLGLAVDVRGFITQGGKRLTVLRDYRRPFVQRVETQLLQSDTFRAVVTPRNDAAHRDHFHLSAKLNLDPRMPEPKIDVRELLGAVRGGRTH